MAYSDFAPPRRSRRRRNVALLIVLAVVIGVLALAVRYRTERRETIDYLTAAADVAVRHQDMAERVGSLLHDPGAEDRPALRQRLETLSTEAKSAVTELADLTPTRPIAEAAGYITIAAQEWEEAIVALDEAIVAVLDAEDGDTTGESSLQHAFDLFRVGDVAYAGFLDSIGRVDPELVQEEFPDVSYTGGDYALLYTGSLLADRLRQNGTLSEDRSIKLVASTVPEPVNKGTGDVWTIPASETFGLEATVSNTGNVVVEKVTVLVTLQQANSADTIPPLSVLIPSIAEGESKKVSFEDLPVVPGEVYTITVEATPEDGVDATPDDNVFSLMFVRNAQ
jgi:hypothetical protein